MKLYHGSYVEIRKPDIIHSRRNVDFGRGFYLTTIYEQAEKWAAKFKRQGKTAVVTCYDFDERALQEFRTLQFQEYSAQWLDFVMKCRRGQAEDDFDIVIGGVANDKVFNTLELFFDGLIDKAEALKRLKYEKPNLQICIRKQSVIDVYLKFERSEKK